MMKTVIILGSPAVSEVSFCLEVSVWGEGQTVSLWKNNMLSLQAIPVSISVLRVWQNVISLKDHRRTVRSWDYESPISAALSNHVSTLARCMSRDVSVWYAVYVTAAAQAGGQGATYISFHTVPVGKWAVDSVSPEVHRKGGKENQHTLNNNW